MPFDKDQEQLAKFRDDDGDEPPSMAWLALWAVVGMLLWVGLFKALDWLLSAAWTLAAA